MFYKPLPDIYKYEAETGETHLTRFCEFLLRKYYGEERTGGRLTYLESKLRSMVNLLGHVIRRYRFHEYLGKGGDRTKYPGYNGSPILFLPSNNNLFSPRIWACQIKVWTAVTENIRRLGLKKDAFQLAREVLRHYHIIEETPGEFPHRTTTAVLNHVGDWDQSVLRHSPMLNLRLYNALAGRHLAPVINPDLKPLNLADAYVKRKGKENEVASKEAWDTVEEVNSLWPEEVREAMRYRRVFNEGEESGGRFYGEVTGMKKGLRRLLLLDPFDMVELDIPAMVPNTMILFATGEMYDVRPYNKVARWIVGKKYRKAWVEFESREEAQDYFEVPLANALKQAIITPFMVDWIERDDANEFSAVWRELVGAGLADGVGERAKAVRDAKTWARKGEEYRGAESVLKKVRGRRWVETVGPDIIQPRFKLKPRDLVEAVEKALPEISDFLFRSNWDWTQFLESELLVSLVSEMRRDNLLPLLIHDAIVVPREFEEKYQELSLQNLKEIVGRYRESVLTPEYEKAFLRRVQGLISRKAFMGRITHNRRRAEKGEFTGKDLKRISRNLQEEIQKDLYSTEFAEEKFYLSSNPDFDRELYGMIEGEYRKRIMGKVS